MKKNIILILTLVSALSSWAQSGSEHRSRFGFGSTDQYYGVRLGLNIASLSSDDVNMDLNSRTGVNVGAVYGVQLAGNTPLWMETGLFYSEKGGQAAVAAEKVKCRLSYLQVPIVVKYSFDVYDDLYINPFLGGYLALGVGGKQKNYGTAAANYADRHADSSFDTFKRFDGGLRIGCGAEYQMVYAEVGFDFGLANISTDDFSNTRNQCFFINLGVNF